MNTEEKFLFTSKESITTARYGLTVIISGNVPTDTFHFRYDLSQYLNLAGKTLLPLKLIIRLQPIRDGIPVQESIGM